MPTTWSHTDREEVGDRTVCVDAVDTAAGWIVPSAVVDESQAFDDS